VQVNKLVSKMWPTPLVPKLIVHDKKFSLLHQESNTDIKFKKSLSWNLLSALPTVWKIIFFGNVINLNKNWTRMQHMDKTRCKYITLSYLCFQLASLSCWNALRKVNLLHTQYNTVSFCYTVIQIAPWCTGRTSGQCSTGYLEQKM